MIYDEIELDFDIEQTAREEIKKLIVQGSAEMTAFQHAFIAGLIKKYKPQKMVEIGVAAGGTTCFFHECLKKYGYNADVFSVDKFETYYRIPNKRTGYLIDEMYKCPGYEDIRASQNTLIGKSIPFYLDAIGKNVDFLLLDTMHCLPGELLDFLVCLPYLKVGAIVVLHDTISNIKNNNGAIATKVLFDVVSAKKIVNLNVDEEPYTKLPNIMAFKVTNETIENARDILSALSCDWNYAIDIDEISAYSKIIKNHYGNEYEKLFIGIENANYRNYVLRYFKDNSLLKRWKNLNSEVLIYGNGLWGSRMLRLAQNEGLVVAGIVVSESIDLTKEMRRDVPVFKISEVPAKYKNMKIIYSLDIKHKSEVSETLKKYKFEFV